MTRQREFDGERWIGIVDAMAVGDPVSSEDTGYVRDHADAEEAKAEQELWDGIASFADASSTSAADDEALIDAVVAGAREREATQGRGRTATVIGIASALAAAAAVVLWVGSTAAPEGDTAEVAQVAPAAPTPVQIETPAVASGTFTAGATTLASAQPVPLGTWLEAGTAEACIDLELATACAAPSSRVQLPSEDDVDLGEGGVTVTVAEGRARPARVKTERGNASSRRGKFEVTVERRTRIVTIVALVGPVTVEDPRAGVRELAEGSSLVLGADVSAANVVPETESAVEIPAPDARAKKPKLSAVDMLHRAQDRMAAKDSKGAIAAYRKLLASYPNSPEAHAALVSTAKLELKVGSHKAALRHFNRYLAKGGANAEEAHLGRIAALEQLGRRDQELKAIGVFLDKYPRNAHAAKLRARAERLRGNAP